MPIQSMTEEQAQQIIELLKQIAKSAKGAEDLLGYLCFGKDGVPRVPKKKEKESADKDHPSRLEFAHIKGSVC